MILAVLSGQRDIKAKLVEANVVEILSRSMLDHLTAKPTASGGRGPGLIMRVVSAAALIPIIDGDDALSKRAVSAGVLDALLPMLKSQNLKEREVAAKVIGMMTKDEKLAQVLYDEGLEGLAAETKPGGGMQDLRAAWEDDEEYDD